MTNSKHPIWRFFASVKLALSLLIVLACVSIIGTVIEQGQAPEVYVDKYGTDIAKVLDVLDLTGMYNSWWYVALLGLFAVNLLLCSFERLPKVWGSIVQDNLSVPRDSLSRMACVENRQVKGQPPELAEQLTTILSTNGWQKPTQRINGDAILLFSQRGAWSRLGVYVVHLSILVILAGAIIGSLFGFQAYVFLPEGRTADQVFLRQTKEPLPLNFTLKCNDFTKTFYDNGMVKQYRADLSVIDPKLASPYRKTVIVNDPLSYDGLTFYVGDAYPLQEYLVVIRNDRTTEEEAFRIPPERDIPWQDGTVQFRIADLALDEEGWASRARISLKITGSPEPVTAWVDNQSSAELRPAGQQYSVFFEQYQSVLLLVTRDPGVLIVYSGCILLIVGLLICFLLSHRRLWIHLSAGKQGKTHLLISGTSNKNRLAFTQRFEKLLSLVDESTRTPR